MNRITDYKPGMTVYGKITGIKPYGAFVCFEDGFTGLIHISEISNGFVKDITNYINVDDYCMLKVVGVDEENKQLRLSFKALASNNRKYYRRVKFMGMPDNKIGFASIQNKMSEWIKESSK